MWSAISQRCLLSVPFLIPLSQFKLWSVASILLKFTVETSSKSFCVCPFKLYKLVTRSVWHYTPMLGCRNIGSKMIASELLECAALLLFFYSKSEHFTDSNALWQFCFLDIFPPVLLLYTTSLSTPHYLVSCVVDASLLGLLSEVSKARCTCCSLFCYNLIIIGSDN